MLGSLLSPVQELGSRGIDCVVMNHHRAIATYSRYGRYVECPNPSFEEDRAIEFLYSYCQRVGGRPVIIPVTDQWTMAVARHVERLGEVAEPCVAGKETIELMLNKELFSLWGHRNGLRTPRVWGLEEVQALPQESFPILVKPKRHRWSSNADPQDLHEEMLKRRFLLIKDQAQLGRFIDTDKMFLEHIFFQQQVRGWSDRIHAVWLYADRSSSIVAMVGGHKIRGCRTNHGDCNLGEKVAVPMDMAKEAAKIVADLHYTGVLELEYKQDAVTGECSIIEVNPHLSGWVGIAPACGVNLPLIAYKDMAGSLEPSDIVPFEGSVRYVRLIADFLNCHIYWKSVAFGPTPQWWQWVRSLRANRVQYFDFYKGDWLVTVLLAYEALEGLVSQMVRSVGSKVKHMVTRSGRAKQ